MSNVPTQMEKVFALGDEVVAAASLLRHGLEVLESYTFASRDADPVFVCLAGGAEKLLKLSVGLHAWDTAGTWPSKAVMQKDFGHDIVNLYKSVRSIIVQGSPTRSTAPGFIAELLDKVDNDPHLDRVLETLGTYAIQGRFYNLDCLANAPQQGDSPKELWEDMHNKLLKLHPRLLMQLASSVEQSDAARIEINKIVIQSIVDWRELITCAWGTRVFGEQARGWAPLFTP